MDTDGINAFNLKASVLKTLDIEPKRGGGISTREDMFVHEKSPVEILELPCLS